MTCQPSAFAAIGTPYRRHVHFAEPLITSPPHRPNSPMHQCMAVPQNELQACPCPHVAAIRSVAQHHLHGFLQSNPTTSEAPPHLACTREVGIQTDCCMADAYVQAGSTLNALQESSEPARDTGVAQVLHKTPVYGTVPRRLLPSQQQWWVPARHRHRCRGRACPPMHNAAARYTAHGSQQCVSSIP